MDKFWEPFLSEAWAEYMAKNGQEMALRSGGCCGLVRCALAGVAGTACRPTGGFALPLQGVRLGGRRMRKEPMMQGHYAHVYGL